MKITVRQLKQLIREAVFAEPVKVGTATTTPWRRGEVTGARENGIHITKLFLDPREYYAGYAGQPREFASLKVYFSDWDVSKFGKIFNDPRFMKEFHRILIMLGFSQKVARSVEYSDKGMQGRNYVDMIVNRAFMDEWEDLVGESSIEL